MSECGNCARIQEAAIRDVSLLRQLRDAAEADVARLSARVAELEEALVKKHDRDLMQMTEEEFGDLVESMKQARAIFQGSRALRGEREGGQHEGE